MDKFYRKYRRLFLGFFIANCLIVVLQLVFAYSHLIKHEYWGLGLSLFFGVFNGWAGWQQYNNWQRVRREEREFMWKTLSTPSGEIR